jgi:hypothetical protein
MSEPELVLSEAQMLNVPTSPRATHENNVRIVFGLFKDAMVPANVKIALALAIDSLTNSVCNPYALRLKSRHKERLLALINDVYHVAWRELQAEYSELEEFAVGIRALGALVMYWASDDLRRGAGGEHLQDAHDHARILQNEMHNFALVEAINDRTKRRSRERSGVIASLLSIPPDAFTQLDGEK